MLLPVLRREQSEHTNRQVEQEILVPSHQKMGQRC